MTSGLIALALAGCQASRSGEGLGSMEVCEPLELAEGEVRVKRVACSDEVPYTGEGRIGDYLLQNARASAIIRSPFEALTLLDMPGGTLVDFITLDKYDVTFEAVPLIDGGWMAPETVETGVDDGGAWVRLTGTTLPLYFLGGSEGEPAEITWRLAPDSDVLEIEGSTDLYFHGRSNTDRVADHLARWDVRTQPLGTLVEDLGGALIYEDVSGILSAHADDTYAALWPDGVRVSGTCDGERVQVWAGDEVVAWLEPDFDTRVPPEADALVCVGQGFADGAPTAPGEGLELVVGEETWLFVRVADHLHEEIPAVVRWSGDTAGEWAGEQAVPPGGGPVWLQPGDYTLTVDYGPRTDPWIGEVSVAAGENRVDVILPRRIDTAGWIAHGLFREIWPSRYSRRYSDRDLALAAGEGLTYVVQVAPDEVAAPYTDDDDDRWLANAIRYQGGSLADTDTAGRVWSWSWSTNSKWSGHGAIQWGGLSAEDVLALASDGLEPYRYNAVDAAWLAAAGPPHRWDPAPMLVYLDAAEQIPAYLEVLEAGVYPGVVGPVTWTRAETDALPSESACERGLVTGASSASSGPLLSLEVGVPIWLDRWVYPLTVSLQSEAEAALTSLELYVDGEVVQAWELPGRGGRLADQTVNHPGERWAIAVARGEGWAVSAPVLLESAGVVPR